MVSPLFPSEHEVEENTTEPVAALTATDPDGGEVTFAIAGGEDAGLFEIRDGNQLAFVGPPDFEAPADAGGDNVYQVAVTATDDEGETSEQPFTVAVTDDPDEPPVGGPPVGEPPVYKAPVYEGPVYEGPVYEGPVYEGPVYKAPIYEAPVAGPPVAGPPVAEPPVAGPPVFTSEPALEGPPTEVAALNDFLF